MQNHIDNTQRSLFTQYSASCILTYCIGSLYHNQADLLYILLITSVHTEHIIAAFTRTFCVLGCSFCICHSYIPSSLYILCINLSLYMSVCTLFLFPLSDSMLNCLSLFWYLLCIMTIKLPNLI